MLIGVEYNWWTIEHRNNNCFNALENNESFIPWDRYEEDKWHHEKPPYAKSKSPYLNPRIDDYQDFLKKSQMDGITLIGVRASESQNRNYYLAKINAQGGISGKNVMYPIYDWKDSDIWKYIKDKNLDFPDVYLRMYEVGVKKNALRVCNLFSIDTCSALVNMFEVYPDLWEKVLKREPNAYLVRLYWDTEMFHRSTKKRKQLEGDSEDKKDYEAAFLEVIKNPEKYFKRPHALMVASQYRTFYLKHGEYFKKEDFKKAYTSLMGGDTKTRSLRALITDVLSHSLDEFGKDEKSWVVK